MSISKLLFLILVVLSVSLCNQKDYTEERQSVHFKIDQYINEIKEQHGVPGIALAAVKNAEIIHQNYYGQASIEHHLPLQWIFNTI